MLGSFYWGGLVSVFAVSWLASRFGPSRVILGGTIPNIIGSFLIPTAAVRGGPYVTLAICFVMGMGQVSTYYAFGTPIPVGDHLCHTTTKAFATLPLT